MKKQEYGAQNIQVLKGLEAVRKRPGMYIGSLGTRGLNHMIYEIVDNSVDEHLAGACNEIHVTLEKDNSCTVEDNGRGIPVGMHEEGVPAERLVLTTLHAGGKFDNNAYANSGGLHGVGSSVVNALSERMTVDVSQNGKIHHDAFEKGIPTVELIDGLLPVIGKTKTTGTKINFLPDKEIFEKLGFKEEEVKTRLKETAFLNPKLTIFYKDNRVEPAEEITFYEPEGLGGYIRDMNQNAEAVSDVIHFSGTVDKIGIEIAMQYTTEFHENVIGFCNNIVNPEGGTHITGFKTALTNVINSYARELGNLKEKDANFTGADVRNGLAAVISVKHPDPRFAGQTKTKLDNSDVVKAVSKLTSEQLQLYFDKNLEELKQVIACAERSAKIRKNEVANRSNMLSKPKYSFESNGKLSNCEGKDTSKNEIFIVEGDSAAGSAKMGRDRSFQAIMAIRGKILNVEKASIDKVLANAEIKTMIYAFGCGFSEGYGCDFDISKLNYNKIILMTDADVDGSHIDILLLTLFYRFMPELIMAGHVYLATPPLYKAIPVRGKEEYLYNDAALADYSKHHTNFTLQRYKGLGEMSAEQLWETTMCPATRILKRVNIEDAKKASEMTEKLMGNDVAIRKEYIYANAEKAKLDV